MTVMRPNFLSSPYFVAEPGNWHLKPGAPESVVKEFDLFMKNQSAEHEGPKPLPKL